MTAFTPQSVLSVHHWNDRLFSLRTSRSASLRFESGQFVMLGLMVEGRPLARAYSIASPAYAEELEFLSIKVEDGPLTSRLQSIQPGDEVLISRKPTGTLLLGDLLPGRHLYLVASGTGLAPFLSLIRDPEVYERFQRIVLVHGVRHVPDLAYRQLLEQELAQDEFLGEQVRAQFTYLPTVTRAPFSLQGRVTDLIDSGELTRAAGLPALDPQDDRFMLCGSPSMLRDVSARLEARGFRESTGIGEPGHYVLERAFVQR